MSKPTFQSGAEGVFGAPNAAQPTASPPTSSPSTTAATSTQSYNQVTTAAAASKPTSGAPAYDSDDDLSDAPESPVLPTFPASPNRPPTASPPELDSDSDLSDAPDDPVWPECSKAPPSAPRCTEDDCPVREAVHRHYQGPYLHNDEPPWTTETVFRDSNPPPHVWESWMKIQGKDHSSTVEDDWNVLGFVRWHVDYPNTSRIGR